MSEDRLKENLIELSQACRTMLEGFDNQTFIRNTAGDHKTTWAVDQLRYLMALSAMDKISSATMELTPIQAQPMNDTGLLDLISLQNCTIHIAYGHSENMPTFVEINPLGQDTIREQTLREAIRKMKANQTKENP